MSFRAIFKHTINYLGANILSKASALILLPILTRVLDVSAADFGVISLYTAYVGIFTYIATLNSFSAVGRYYYEETDDFRSFFGTVVNLNILLISVSFVVFLLFRGSISNFLEINVELTTLIFLSVVAMVVYSLYEQIYIAKMLSKQLAILNVTKTYIILALIILLTLLNPTEKYLGSIYGRLAVDILVAFYLVKLLRPYFTFSFKWEHIKYALILSVPMIFYTISHLVMNQFDRIMIAKYCNLEDAGLYSFAYSIGSLLTVVFFSLNSAWIPNYCRHLKAKEYTDHDKSINLIHRIILVSALGLIFFGKEIGMILGSEEFYSSLGLIPPIVIGYVFQCYFYFYAWVNEYLKKTYWSALILVLSGAVNVIANIIFIPKYGYEAAAYTTMFSYFVMAVLSYTTSRYFVKEYVIPIRKLYKPFFVFFIFVFSYYIVGMCIDWQLIEIIVKSIIFLLAIYIIFKSQIEDYIQKKRLNN